MKGENRPGLEPDKGDEDLHGRGQGFHRVHFYEMIKETLHRCAHSSTLPKMLCGMDRSTSRVYYCWIFQKLSKAGSVLS